MKGKVRVGDLAEALVHLKGTRDKASPTITGFAYFKFENKTVGDQKLPRLVGFTTDLVSQTLKTVAAISIEEEGSVLADLDGVSNFLVGWAPEDEVTITKVETKDLKVLQLQCRRSRARVALGPDAAKMKPYIEALPFTGKTEFSLQGKDFVEFCRRGMFCIPHNDSGQAAHIAGGLQLSRGEKSIEAHATDGSIAAEISMDGQASGGEEMEPFMIPVKSLAVINSLMARHRGDKVDVILGEKGVHGPSSVFFRAPDTFIGCKLIAGRFPPVKKIMDNARPKTIFDIAREELRVSLGRASAFLGHGHSIHIEVQKEKLDLHTASGVSDLDDSIPIQPVEGYDKPIKIMLNLDYLFNVASGSVANTLRIGVSNSTAGILITDDSDEHVKSRYVFMPIKP